MKAPLATVCCFWPIFFFADHRSLSLITLDAWLECDSLGTAAGLRTRFHLYP